MTQSTVARAGRFHQGRLCEGRPQVLDAWRVTTDDAEVVARAVGFLGGRPRPNAGGGLAHEVLTNRESVRVLLDGPDAVAARMVRWSSKGDGPRVRRFGVPVAGREVGVALRLPLTA